MRLSYCEATPLWQTNIPSLHQYKLDDWRITTNIEENGRGRKDRKNE